MKLPLPPSSNWRPIGVRTQSLVLAVSDSAMGIEPSAIPHLTYRIYGLPFPCPRPRTSNKEFETSAMACSVRPPRRWMYCRVVREFEWRSCCCATSDAYPCYFLFGQAQAQLKKEDFLINPRKPFVYLEMNHFGPRKPLRIYRAYTLRLL
jgi:hypothetical protein